MRPLRAAERTLSLAMLLVLTGLAPTAAAGPQTQRFVLGRGLSVAAPAPGYGMVASAITSSGEDMELILETGLDGVTRDVTAVAATNGTVESSGATIAGSPAACNDTKFALLPMKWKTTWDWSFQYRSTPSEIGRAAAESRLRSAVASITGERNDCNRPDTVDATSRYQGRTTTKPGVLWSPSQPSEAPRCVGDGLSVVGFGSLPPGVLGLTCTRYQIITGAVDTAVESDVLFNKRSFDWATSMAGCTDAAVLRSIATHEFGHVFGLNHVSEGSHGNLTMSPAIGACDDSAFTLGKGDMLGLERRY